MAFLFGSERYGMRNEDVYRCHVALTIPTAPDYGSLNLAAAVQLLAYEWRQALGGFAALPSAPATGLADAQAVAGMLEHWERALVDIGFLDPAAPKKLMPRLNRMFNRAQPDAGGDPHPARCGQGDAAGGRPRSSSRRRRRSRASSGPLKAEALDSRLRGNDGNDQARQACSSDQAATAISSAATRARQRHLGRGAARQRRAQPGRADRDTAIDQSPAPSR